MATRRAVPGVMPGRSISLTASVGVEVTGVLLTGVSEPGPIIGVRRQRSVTPKHSEQTAQAGRPRASSRGMLAEAAGELFLEQTYAGTTVDDIARRAGVSRATFFNYFAAKSDLLWLEVDEALDAFDATAASVPPELAPMDAVLEAVT